MKDRNNSCTWISATVTSLTMFSCRALSNSWVRSLKVNSAMVGNGIIFSLVRVTTVLTVILAVSSIGGIKRRKNIDLWPTPLPSKSTQIAVHSFSNEVPTKPLKQQGHVISSTTALYSKSGANWLISRLTSSSASFCGNWSGRRKTLQIRSLAKRYRWQCSRNQSMDKRSISSYVSLYLATTLVDARTFMCSSFLGVKNRVKHLGHSLDEIARSIAEASISECNEIVAASEELSTQRWYRPRLEERLGEEMTERRGVRVIATAGLFVKVLLSTSHDWLWIDRFY